MSASEFPAETGRQVGHPWLCDANEHVNTRHLQGWYDDAAQHLLGLCGFEGLGAERLSVADVSCTMTYTAEVRSGALVTLRSGFARLGRSSFETVHVMMAPDGREHGRCRTATVFFDLDARRSAPIPDTFRARAEALLVADQGEE